MTKVDVHTEQADSLTRPKYVAVPDGASEHGTIPPERPLPSHWEDWWWILCGRHDLSGNRSADLLFQLSVRLHEQRVLSIMISERESTPQLSENIIRPHFSVEQKSRT